MISSVEMNSAQGNKVAYKNEKIKKKLFELANNQDFILKKLETLENNFHSSQTTTNQKLDQLISKLDRY